MTQTTRHAQADDAVHLQARLLAAGDVDEGLTLDEKTWLGNHLASCPACSTAVDEFRAMHQELRSLQAPESPRDLWARTSAALDQAEARSGGHARTGRASRRPLFGTAFAVLAVALVAGASLLSQSPIALVPTATGSNGIALASGALPSGVVEAQAPLAVVNGTSYWIDSTDGVYKIKGSSADCTTDNTGCTVSSTAGQTLGSIASDSQVSAVLSGDASQAAVWTSDKIAIVPLATTSQTVSLDQLTPRPTVVATATPTSATATATATATTAPASLPVASATAATVPPLATSVASAAASATPATASPTAVSTRATAVSGATAILDGYEVVGTDPQFSADGTVVAFSARPVDHSTGPDVFVWHAGDEQAHAVTSPRHADLFAGWFDGRILINEIGAGSGGSAESGTISTTAYTYDPATGHAFEIDRPMLIAGVDPTGTFLIYWTGSVEFDTSTGLWRPGQGDLYFDRLANLDLRRASLDSMPSPIASAAPTASPTFAPSPATVSASEYASASASFAEPSASGGVEAGSPMPEASTLPQRLSVAGAAASVRDWLVRWDAAGQNVTVWVADPGSADIGRLSLFSIDRAAGILNPILAAQDALSSMCFDAGNLIYTSALDGKTYVKPVPVLPPSPATPTPSVAPASPLASPTALASHAPDTSTAPGV